MHSYMNRSRARWWLFMAAAHTHLPVQAMAVVELEPGNIGYGGLIVAGGVFSAFSSTNDHPELLSAYAPNFHGVLKWFFRVGAALIALELILSKFGILVETRHGGVTLLEIWAFGHMGLACYISGIAAHIRDKRF
jgi:hypothetical protein